MTPPRMAALPRRAADANLCNLQRLPLRTSTKEAPGVLALQIIAPPWTEVNKGGRRWTLTPPELRVDVYADPQMTKLFVMVTGWPAVRDATLPPELTTSPARRTIIARAHGSPPGVRMGAAL